MRPIIFGLLAAVLVKEKKKYTSAVRSSESGLSTKKMRRHKSCLPIVVLLAVLLIHVYVCALSYFVQKYLLV